MSSNGVISPAATVTVRASTGPQWVQTVVLSCNTGGSVPQCASTDPVNITATAGNTILLVFWYNSFPTSVQVSDSNNDAFSLWASVPTTDLNDANGVVYAAKNVVGGATTVNLTFNSNVPATLFGAALEYTGVASGIDASVRSNALLTSQQQGQTFDSGTFATSFNDELAFGLAVADFGWQNDDWTPRVGCTPQTESQPPYYSNSGYFCFEETTAATMGSYDAMFITDFHSNGGLGGPPSNTAPNGYGIAGFSIY